MSTTEPKKLELLYTLFCDDVRLEAGNKLSFMGVFQNIMVQQLPVSLIKFAVVNHWQGRRQLSFRSADPHARSKTPNRCLTADEVRDRVRRFRRQHQFLC